MQINYLALGGLLAVVGASPLPDNIHDASSLSKRDIIVPLGQSYDNTEIRFQPLLDFDRDSCYNTAAISPNGYTNPGKGATSTPQGQCRDLFQLRYSNTYSRKRCNNGYCAIMYEYYFEKDQAVGGSFLGGHRHEWENIIVFTRGDEVVRVAPSCHGRYGGATNNGFQLYDKHPYMVYHKDGASTHCFRVANNNDISHPENVLGYFFRSELVSWDHWPSLDLRNKMLNTWKGGIGPKLDDEFGDTLRAAAGNGVPGFNPYSD